MNFKKMVQDTDSSKPISIDINKFTVKNKGSVMKIGTFYADFYNDLIEKWGLKCTETSFTNNELDQTVKAMLWEWEAYSKIDNFARVKFNLSVNAFRIVGDTVMGIFGIRYALELDYGLVWRSNALTKWYLPIYLRTYYKGKMFSWIDRYMDDLNAIKEKLMERLNMSTYD